MKNITYLILILLGFHTALYSQNNNDIEDGTSIDKTRVRFVVLNTTDVTVTEDHINRLRDIGEYIEDYYADQLTGKGYVLANTNMFARNTDGDILIYDAISAQEGSEVSNITQTGATLAKETYTDLTDENSIWAVAHFITGGGFAGGGTINHGGMRFQLKDVEGSIDVNSHMSETSYHRELFLKAIHHELGHALTITHNGPLRNDTTHNIMMGPTNQSYETIVGIPQTTDVRISDYSAAILAYHPIFQDAAFDIAALDNKTLKIETIEGDTELFSVDCATGIAHVRGKVTSNLPFHDVMVRFGYVSVTSGGGYWNKAFAVPTDANGIFDLELTADDINIGAPAQNDFEYSLLVAFDNGLSRGITQIGVDEPIDVNKNKYINTYLFDTDTSISQNITQSENTISTDYTDATSYQWIDCNNNNEPIVGATSQSYTPVSNGSYAVKVVVPNGCTHTSDCFNATVLGVDEFDTFSQVLNIYPNPSNGSFFIQSKHDQILEITVYTMIGQKLIQKEYNHGENVASIAPLKKGIHIVQVKTDKGIYTSQIIASK